MNSSLFGQIALIIVAIILIVSFIQPTMASIGEIQDELFEVNDAISKIELFNDELQSKLLTIESIPQSDIDALDTFLPTEVDVLGVMADIAFIADSAGVTIETLSNDQAEENSSTNSSDVKNNLHNSVAFALTITGGYQSFKDFLTLTEYNDYPLHVTSIEIGRVNSDSSANGEGEDISNTTSNQTYSLTITVPMFDAEAVTRDETSNSELTM